MSAFVSCAVSALNRCLRLIDILDPKGEDVNLRDMRNQINIYIAMYKEIDKSHIEKPIIDETWKKIKEASDLTDEELEQFEKVIFDA